mmetsp:Transcript_22090/g.65959  ORF Transcript_22090/g.65959 Transcript_22090/m.65959 type:complete len:209 (-) Transcript_22090:182-808(-)
MVDLLQRLEPLRLPRSLPVRDGDLVFGDQVRLLLYARACRGSGLGRDEAVFGPPDHPESPGFVLLVHHLRLHPGVGAVLPPQPLAVVGVRSLVSAARGLAEWFDILLDLHRLVELEGDFARAAAERQARIVRAAMENLGGGLVDCIADSAVPDLRPLAQHQHKMALPVVFRGRRLAHIVSVRLGRHDVLVGAAHEQPALRVLPPGRRG